MGNLNRGLNPDHPPPRMILNPSPPSHKLSEVKATENELIDARYHKSPVGFVRSFIFGINDKKAVLILFGFAALLMLPIAVWGIPEGADLPNHYRYAMPFYDSILKGDFYPGWLAESNAGYGDARFRFYPPGLYYLLALFKPLAGWFGSSLITFVLLSALGSLGVYFWARAFLEHQFALVAAVLYAIAPYHLNELYQASLLSEYAACAPLPFVFAFIDRICERKRMIDVAGLAAAYALLILSNLPLAVIGSLAALVFTLVRVTGKAALPVDMRLAVGVFVGLAASAFYWMRMLSELPWIKGSAVNPKVYYDYRLNFIFSPSALTNRNTWYANLLALATISLFLPALVLFWKGSGKRYVALFILTIFSFFMTLPLSQPLWQVIPKLSEVQFPWRWLAVTSLTGSVLVAASIPHWLELLKSRFRPIYSLPALGVLFSLIFIATQIVWDSDYMTRQELDSFLPKTRAAVSFKDWLPVEAHELAELPKMTEDVTTDSRPVKVEAWEPEYRRFTVSGGAAAQARVKTFYYPNWRASSDGLPLTVQPSPEGVMLVHIPDRATTVEITFQDPLKVRIAGWVSALSWIAVLIAGSLSISRKRTMFDLKQVS